jgi:DNA polymerase III delta prime subunit
MKGSVLLYGGNKADLDSKVIEMVLNITGKDFSLQEIKDPDIKVIGYEAERILTAEVEDAISFLHEKPYAGNYKILIILQADKIQPRTQNYLLKTLEETPSYATVILTSKTLQDIIETVQSRCRKINVKRTSDTNNEEVTYVDLVLFPYEKKFSWVEEVAKEEKEEIVKKLEAWIEQGRGELQKKPGTTVNNLKLLKDVKKDLETTNVNTRLALENLVMSLE